MLIKHVNPKIELFHYTICYNIFKTFISKNIYSLWLLPIIFVSELKLKERLYKSPSFNFFNAVVFVFTTVLYDTPNLEAISPMEILSI